MRNRTSPLSERRSYTPAEAGPIRARNPHPLTAAAAGHNSPKRRYIGRWNRLSAPPGRPIFARKTRPPCRPLPALRPFPAAPFRPAPSGAKLVLRSSRDDGPAPPPSRRKYPSSIKHAPKTIPPRSTAPVLPLPPGPHPTHTRFCLRLTTQDTPSAPSRPKRSDPPKPTGPVPTPDDADTDTDAEIPCENNHVPTPYNVRMRIETRRGPDRNRPHRRTGTATVPSRNTARA